MNLPFSEACEHNKGSILLILQEVLKGVLSVLEIGSGTGQHAVFIRTEEVPQYEVIHAEGVYEIREYPSYLIAETKVEGDYDEAVNKGFRRLAAYIFGNNLSRRSFQNELQVQPDSSEKISMTAPVEVMKEDWTFWSVSFVMPSQYTIDSLPTPKDPRVVVREMGNRKTAVFKTSGF